MPTYVCTAREGQLSPDQKSRIAAEVTRIHSEVTGAPKFFAQVIFEEVKPGNHFMGGVPLVHDQLYDQIFVYGRVRAGRSIQEKLKMIKLMADAVG
jgi:phenylpyruvate tautomerase PptA (4-oxalocrotonate tautomerase family)